MNRTLSTFWISVVSCALLLIACRKNDVQPVLKSVAGGFALAASSKSLVLDTASATSITALSLNWGAVDHGVPVASVYTLQADSLQGGFLKPVEFTISAGTLKKSFSKAELNSLALQLGLKPQSSGRIKFRVKEFLNDNVQPFYTDTLSILVTPYSTLVLKYAMPKELYIQGDAVASNWGYPLDDSQKFEQIDEYRFGIIVYLNGKSKYDFITSNNAWGDPAYKGATWNEPVLGGNFIPSGSATTPAWGGADITSPDQSGYYQIIVDFKSGTYKLTEYSNGPLTAPNELYLVGDAAPMGWAAPDQTQQFVKVDANTFLLRVKLNADKQYAFITSANTWSDPAYILPAGSVQADNIETGSIIASGSQNGWAGLNIKSPLKTGNYKITVHFKSGVFTTVAD